MFFASTTNVIYEREKDFFSFSFSFHFETTLKSPFVFFKTKFRYDWAVFSFKRICPIPQLELLRYLRVLCSEYSLNVRIIRLQHSFCFEKNRAEYGEKSVHFYTSFQPKVFVWRLLLLRFLTWVCNARGLFLHPAIFTW